MADTTAGVLRIGNVVVDVRIRESHNLSMKLTQYAVESGNSISDHIIAAPNEVEIEFEMTNTPTGSGGEQPGDRARRAFQDFVAMLLARKPVQIVTEHATYKDMVFVGFSPEHSAPNLGTLRGTAKFQQAGIIGRENTVSGRDETSLSGYPSRRNAVGAGRQRMDMRTNRDTTYRTGCTFIDSGIQSIRDDQSKNDKIARKLTLYAGGIF